MGRYPTISKLTMPDEEVEMALAWLRGEMSLAQIAEARGKFNASNSLAWVGPRLREAWRRGLLITTGLGEGGDEDCS